MAKTKLLIVEDNEQDKELLLHVLNRFSFDVVCVHTGYEAKEKYDDDDFDAVLMNMSLPDIVDPLHLIRWFRSKKPEIPIAIVSGNTDPALRPKIYESGAVMLFCKPFTSADNMGLLALLEVTRAAYTKGRRMASRNTTIFGSVTVGVGVSSAIIDLANGRAPDWASVTVAITAGIGLIRAADAEKKLPK